MSNKNKSGLDIELGNTCSQTAFNWAKKTYQFRDSRKGQPAQGLDGSFSNLLIFGDEKIGIASDGIGTKIEIAERTGIYNTLGYDLVAMVADDLATAGFEPTNISNIIDVDLLDHDTIDKLMQGLHDACKFSNITISGGEIAELGNRIGGYGNNMHFNWCSTAIGTLPENLQNPIDSSNVKENDLVLSLQSRGFRSNGFSMIRKILSAKFGDNWHLEKYDEQQTWGEITLTPSLIYSPLIVELIAQNINLSGICHITGGGIEDNLNRVLKKNKLGAELTDLFPPHQAMTDLMQMHNLSKELAYTYWNMGNGMLIICNELDADRIINIATNRNYNCQVAGKINNKQKITIA